MVSVKEAQKARESPQKKKCKELSMPITARPQAEIDTPKISVLVPIYNVEQYLPRCLESLQNQTLSDIEIICINDGSPDQSVAIVRNLMENDPRIMLIDKKNSGYGDSMNQGIKQARGEYIAILEPDDYIELNAFERLYELASWHDADMVKANYYKERAGKCAVVTEIKPRDTGKLINPRQEQWIFKFAPAIWSAIYKREFLEREQIDFLPTPGASYQDVSFSFKVWALSRKVILTDECFVHYRLDNENSSVNSPAKVNCVVEEYREIETFLSERGLFTELGPIMEAVKFLNYHWNLQRLSPELAAEFYPQMCQEFLLAEEEGILHRADFSRKYWFALKLMLKHPRLAFFLLRLRASLKKMDMTP